MGMNSSGKGLSIKGAFSHLFNSKAKGFKGYGMSVELQKTGKLLRRLGPAYSLLFKWLDGAFYKDL